MNEVVCGKNADEVYCRIFRNLEKYGCIVNGRNGKTKELTHVCLKISDATQRWVVNRKPVISPAFAIAELVMIMNGNDEAALLNTWNPALPKYQGEYQYYPGAYGKRLRNSFGFDQINKVYETLKYNPESRQAVLEIWKPDLDLPHDLGRPNNKDIPCNICSLLKIRQGKLLWTQIMRSNDIVFGLPYNFLQFTFLQEIIAGWLNIGIGEYMHVSDSLHMYSDNRCHVNCKHDMHLNYKEQLKLEKKISDNVFEELLARMKELSSGQCTCEYIKEIIHARYLPEAYQNMLGLLCEYVAFSQNMGEELIEYCELSITSLLYRDLMKKWIKERKKKRSQVNILRSN